MNSTQCGEKRTSTAARIFFAVFLLAAGVGCGNAKISKGFSEKRFRTVAAGDSIDVVEQKVGRPLRCLVYAKKNYVGKVFGDQLFLQVDFETVKKWSTDPRVFVVLEYSIQRNSYLPYNYWHIDLQDGQVTQAIVSTVGD